MKQNCGTCRWEEDGFCDIRLKEVAADKEACENWKDVGNEGNAKALAHLERNQGMLTLRELFKLTWDISELCITARRPEDHRFIHEWMYGEYLYETTHLYHKRRAGELTFNPVKIQHHGEHTRGGSEIGWGVKEKLFPSELLDAPITHLTMWAMSQGRGTKAYVDIEMQELTAMALVPPEPDGVTDPGEQY